MKKKILVTGGCGYIGCHVTKLLSESGFEVIVLDNLTTGFISSLLYNETLVEGDIGDTKILDKVFSAHKFDGLIHFAASIVVPESVKKPLEYYKNNTANTLTLLEYAKKFDLKNIIFSSTAAVYGNTNEKFVNEEAPLNPESPYARSKLMDEWILKDLSLASDIKHIILRYFNVAGADADGKIGHRFPNATHLIKVACETALGKRDSLSVFGTDYPTKDGTGVRDYIHISDLASAHVLALEYLLGGGTSQILNCGYGRGYSVKEVIETVKKVSGVDFKINISKRREGDPAEIVSDPGKIKKLLNWKARFESIETIVKTALDWEKTLFKV